MCYLLNACNQNQTSSEQVKASNSSQDSTSTECPEQPKSPLKAENIKTIQFKNKELIKSGIIQNNEMIGYQFQGEANQQLNYQTNDNLCVWIFTPDNQLLQQSKLPLDGTYIMQISTPIGSRSFEMTINLEPQDSLNFKSNIVKKESQKISPTKAVITHYQQLNNRNYKQTWNKLSQNFKHDKISNRFSTYTNWWNKVRTIEIGQVKLINEFEETAVVDAQLTYFMQNGEQYDDPKSQIILMWDSQKNTWLIDDKIAPDQSQY